MSTRLPPLNALRVYETIYRRGSIRQAAEELCLTPQAVSQQLKLLESFLDTQLFERSVRGITPTSAAHALYEPISRGFNAMFEGISFINRYALGHSLLIQVSPYFATHYLIRNLLHFRKQYPWIDLKIKVGVELPNFNQTSLDAAIHWGYGGQLNLAELPLIEDLRVIAASPAILKREPIKKPKDLLRHTIVTSLIRNSLWNDVFELLKISPSPAMPTLELHSHDAMLEAVLAGLGVGHLSYMDAVEHIQSGRLEAPFGIDLLKQLPLEKAPRFSLYYRPRDSANIALKEFRHWLKSHLCTPELIGFASRF